MFFWLKEELDVVGSMPILADYIEPIENLGEAGYRKEHLVLGDRSIILKIMDLDLSRRAKIYYKSVLSKYSTLGGIARGVKRVFVSTGCHAPVQDSVGWTVPLSSFSEIDSAVASILVVEHMYDYEVMLGLTDLHLIENGLASMVGLKFFPAAGGGGGTHLSLSTYQRNVRSFGICVLDSDRPHVSGALGNTAKTCEKIYLRSWRWDMHIIAGRELENLIPPGVLSSVGINIPFAVEGYFSDEKWPVIGYADTKVGDSICRFRSISPDSQSFRPTAAVLQRYFAENGGCDEGVCANQKCVLCSPSENILSDLAARARAGDIRKLRRIPERVDALDRLLSAVASAGAVAKWQIT